MKKISSVSYQRYIDRLKAAGFDFESCTDQIHKDADAAISVEPDRVNQIFEDTTKIRQKKVEDDNG